MRTFKAFPLEAICPICNTSDEGECILIPIINTESGNNIKAIPVHTNCLEDTLMYYPEANHAIIALPKE